MRRPLLTAAIAGATLLIAGPAAAGHDGTCPASWDRVLVDGNDHLAEYDDNGDGYVCTTDVNGSEQAPDHRHKDNNGPKNQAEAGPLN